MLLLFSENNQIRCLFISKVHMHRSVYFVEIEWWNKNADETFCRYFSRLVGRWRRRRVARPLTAGVATAWRTSHGCNELKAFNHNNI